MCLRVFCETDDELYHKLSQSARSLGSALQKINFLRDMKADFRELGRIYFPGADFNSFTNAVKKQIETDIRNDLGKGLEGIKLLPKGPQLGVYIAYTYYKQLFKKICDTPAEVILQKKIRIPDTHKLILYFKNDFTV